MQPKARILAASLALASGFTFSAHAQVQQPSKTDVSPTMNTDVSSIINTGNNYDLWSGSIHRRVVDLEIPGAVSELGLKWVRTYNSGSKENGNAGWSFSWTWRYWGAGWANPQVVVLPDGGIWRPGELGTKLLFLRNGLQSSSTWANLYLEDGSMVYMDGYTDYPDDASQNLIEHYFPEYVLDRYGQKTTLTYEQIDADSCYSCDRIRLVQVTDPSGRYIKITYAGNGFTVTRVEGSNGSRVDYSSGPEPNQFHVDYHDGTVADYYYGDTTFREDSVCCPGGNCQNCVVTSHAPKLIRAQDTHADGPMQSIQYQYASPGKFEGQIRAEQHYPSLAAVSTLDSNSCPTHSYSTSDDCPSAEQTETRGDGPSHTIKLVRKAGHVPLVTWKEDYQPDSNGVRPKELFEYDSNNYLKKFTDRNGKITQYTNTTAVGSPLTITHPGGTAYDGSTFPTTTTTYTYTDINKPFWIYTIKDDRGNTTTYHRDENNRITSIAPPALLATPFPLKSMNMIR